MTDAPPGCSYLYLEFKTPISCTLSRPYAEYKAELLYPWHGWVILGIVLVVIAVWLWMARSLGAFGVDLNPEELMAKPTLAQQLAEAERELTVRQRVYPKWIKAKRIAADKAASRIERQAAIVETLRQVIEAERQPGLFDG